MSVGDGMGKCETEMKRCGVLDPNVSENHILHSFHSQVIVSLNVGNILLRERINVRKCFIELQIESRKCK